MMGYLILSVVCLAILIAINWYMKEDLAVSDFVLLAACSAIPIVNLLVVALFVWAMITDTGVEREVIILKGRGK